MLNSFYFPFQKYLLHALIVLSFLFHAEKLNGQRIIIDSLQVSGNKKTRERVIFRELTFSLQDTLGADEDLQALAEYNEKRLLGIGLFNQANINFYPMEGDSSRYNVHIEVNENWYIYPSPIFELADRNFNLWWYELGRDLTRVNYGLRGEHINLSGNRDKLSLTAQWGYTRKLELKYNFPFLDYDGQWSTSFNAFYATVREIAYTTAFNKTQFARYNDEVMLSRFRLGADIAYRKDLYSIHAFRLEFHSNEIHPYAATSLNPNYFLNGKTRQQFFFFNYTYFYDTRNFPLFPVSGYLFHANLKKEGLFIFKDLNNMSLALEFEQHFSRQQRVYWNYRIKIKANLNARQQPFANNTALGWSNDIIRGYEIYAIDGSDFAYAKTNGHLRLIDKDFNFSGILSLNQFNRLNLKLFLGGGIDVGWVNERFYRQTNDFNNRLIYGLGPTLSFMIYNTYLFQFDYSINHTGEGGVFVKNKISF